MYTLRSYLNDLDQAITSLIEGFNTYSVKEYCIAFKIDKVLKEDEETLIDNGYNKIVSTHITGETALAHLLSGIKDLTEEDDTYSRRFVTKYPGFIVVDNLHDIQQRVEAVNSAKKAFKAAVMNINRPDRFESVHDARPYLITSNVYRLIHLCDARVDKLYFNYASRVSQPLVDYDSLIQQLESAAKQPPVKTSAEHWERQIASETSLVKRHRYAEFKRVRTLKVRPEVSIRLTQSSSDSKPFMYGTSAGLPVILGNKPAGYSELGDYTPKPTSKPKMVGWSKLIDRLDLYVRDT